MNFVLSIVALVIAIVGCVVAVRLLFFQPLPLGEEKISAMIEEKTKGYITEGKATEIVEQLLGEFKETLVEKQGLEQQIEKLEKRGKEVEQRVEKLEKKGNEFEQLVVKLEKTLIKGNELNQRVAKLEKKVSDVEQQLEERGKEIEQLITELKQKARLPEIVIMRNIYRISPFRSSVDPEYKDLGGPDQYIVIIVDGKEVLKTRVALNTFLAKWWGDYQVEVVLGRTVQGEKVLSFSEIEVYLMDKNPGAKDNVIAHWTVNDPFELEKLSKDGNSVEFIVEKIEEKVV